MCNAENTAAKLSELADGFDTDAQPSINGGYTDNGNIFENIADEIINKHLNV